MPTAIDADHLPGGWGGHYNRRILQYGRIAAEHNGGFGHGAGWRGGTGSQPFSPENREFFAKFAK
jgi:hypothetical protein